MSCPFCPFSSLDVSELQIHVVTAHVEEMKTPTKHCSATNNRSKDMKDQEDDEACLVCGERFPTAIISLHVQTHFLDAEGQGSGSRTKFERKSCNNRTGTSGQSTSTGTAAESSVPSCSNLDQASNSTDLDRILAQQLEQEEIRRMNEEKMGRQAAEEVQLEMLREEQHFEPSGNYFSQAVKSMEKYVGRKKLSITDYYRKKFNLLENLEAGIDDASTCTTNASGKLANKLDAFKISDLRWVLCTHVSHFGRIPSIPKLQHMIETAWSDGFDASGRVQLENKLVGTRKWIGATEAFTLLSSLRFHCRIVDFHRFSDMKSRRHLLLFDWLAGYFQSHDSANRVHREDLPPVYLQHAGHSRTVFGVEYNDKSTRPSRLVLFDPSDLKREVEVALASKKINSGSLFLKPLNSFTESQYQAVCVVGVASPERYEIQKNVDKLSERMPS